jgi:eukaryotic translation initiation factor 2C
MCYLYGRATKAVSICPPAYYADLVCTRSRVHKNELFEDDTPPGSQTGALAQAEDAIRARRVHPNLEHTMYYI